jgi:hypothetical protein
MFVVPFILMLNKVPDSLVWLDGHFLGSGADLVSKLRDMM